MTIAARITLNIKYFIPLASTMKFVFINKVKTGNKIAAPTDPIDTILLNAIIAKAKTKHINPIFQFIIIITPSDVATPFPPLNSKNIGKV